MSLVSWLKMHLFSLTGSCDWSPVSQQENAVLAPPTLICLLKETTKEEPCETSRGQCFPGPVGGSVSLEPIGGIKEKTKIKNFPHSECSLQNFNHLMSTKWKNEQNFLKSKNQTKIWSSKNPNDKKTKIT